MEFMTNIYDISKALSAVLLLVALGWSISLRRRVREQSEQIRIQLRREASLEEKYRDLFEQANDMVFSHALNGKLTSLNKAGERILGCAREQALRMSLREFVVPAQIESFDQWLSRCLAGITPTPFELEIVGRNEVHSVLDVGVRLVREGGQIVAVEGIARDITEKKRAEQALRQSEERFSSAFRVSPVAIGICNLTEWRFIDVNQSFLRLFGFDRNEVIDHTATELKLWPEADDRTRIENMFRNEQSVGGAECKFRVKSGGLRTTLLFAERIDLGNVPCALTIVHDITDRLNLEAQLRQALKMEAVGRLAAGVAHDFNNLLTIIQCSTDLAIQQTDHSAGASHALQRISEATLRAASLTRQLLTFSRQQNLQREPLALNEVINNGIRMFKHLLRDDINLRFRFSPNLPIVNADPTMVEQVIMNLVVNARDAMPNGGDLLLETALVEIGPAYIQNHPEAVAGSFVCLIVADTGCGMDAVTQSRIFEPFFTTKEAGKGTGLGLATVYGIVKQHDGWIEVLSEVGHGSTFKIFIPADMHADSAVKQSEPHLSGNGKKSILVVEGESAVAELIQQVLEAEGYRLLQASNALVALQVWNDHEGRIDLLLTDVQMLSGMSGVDIAENLRALKPDLKVLYVTGYSPDTVNPNAVVSPNAMVLPKPFSRTDLVKAVRLSLEGPKKPVG
jgi:two-component system, cell cycle sensor histidine kinase and response regulator CckA